MLTNKQASSQNLNSNLVRQLGPALVTWSSARALLKACPPPPPSGVVIKKTLVWENFELTILGTTNSCRIFGSSHWNGDWQLSGGEWSLVTTNIVKFSPWFSSFWPLVKKWTHWKILLFNRAWWANFVAKEAMLLLWHCRIMFINCWPLWIRNISWFHGGAWMNRWHQMPCIVYIIVQSKTPNSAWNFRREIMHIYIRSRTLEIPAYFIFLSCILML